MTGMQTSTTICVQFRWLSSPRRQSGLVKDSRRVRGRAGEASGERVYALRSGLTLMLLRGPVEALAPLYPDLHLEGAMQSL